jgi:hypothetical protein
VAATESSRPTGVRPNEMSYETNAAIEIVDDLPARRRANECSMTLMRHRSPRVAKAIGLPIPETFLLGPTS